MWEGGTSLNSGSESGGHKHIFALHSENCGGGHLPPMPPPVPTPVLLIKCDHVPPDPG